MTARKAISFVATAAGLTLTVASAGAQRAAVLQQGENRIENQVAVFAALDKVTARISRLEVQLGDSVKFGALTVTPRSCYTRSPLETPKTSTFVEVSERQLDGQDKKIFGGWMFAESPGLNAVEHPVYDVWLTDCAKPKTVAAGPATKGGSQPSSKASAPTQPGQPQPAVRPTAPSTGAGASPPAAAPPGQPTSPAPGDPAAEDFKRRRPPR